MYQSFLSPLLGKNCRFNPTCSTYTHDALMKYGAIKGSYLSIKRLLRCHPFSKKTNYYDPVQ